MFFALIDLIKYKLKKGPYGADQKDAAIGYFSHYGEVSQLVIDQLERGDFIFTQRLDSIMSWGAMYFGSASIDHVGVYIGHGRMRHMTLEGDRTHHVNVVARGARVVAIRPTLNAVHMAYGERSDGGYLDRSRAVWHGLPPNLQLIFYLPRILTGYYPTDFRWKFLADIFLVALLIDAPIWVGLHLLIALPFAGVAAIRTGYNLLKYRLGKRSNRAYRILSHPNIAYKALFNTGGIIFAGFDSYAFGPWGMLPLDLFIDFLDNSALCEGGIDDSAAEVFQEIGQRVRDAVQNGEFILVPPDARERIAQ